LRSGSRAPRPRCEPALVSAIESALTIELVDAEAAVVALIDGGELHASVVCDAESMALRVEHLASRVFVGQRINAGEDGRARRVALVLVQLASATEDAARRSAREEPRPTEPSEPAASVPGVRLWARIRGGMSAIGNPLRPGGGGGLGLEVELARLALALDLEAFVLDHGVPLGDVDVVPFGASVEALGGGRFGALALHAGPALHVGASWAAGRPRDPSRETGRSVLEPYVAVALATRAGLLVANEWLRLDLALEGGAVVYGPTFTVAGEPALRMVGPWLSIRLGIAIAIAGRH
jgi:hypothetical protein